MLKTFTLLASISALAFVLFVFINSTYEVYITSKERIKFSKNLVQKHNLPNDVIYSCIAGKVHYFTDKTVIRYEPMIDCGED
jgi:hypothetical protein